MLQWLGPDFNQKIIYNDLIDNSYCSIIHNLKTKENKIIDRSIYSVAKNGKFALSLNFSRLHRLRPGYGYSNLPDKTKGENYPKNDGIYFVDLENNSSKLIISLDQIIKINHNHTMEDVEHRFNHLDISPDGKRFSFIHRWEHDNVTQSRFFTSDIDGNNIYCLTDEEMVSHSCWKNNEEILVWARKNNKDRYYLIKDKTSESKIIGEGKLTSDGHPSYSPYGRYILTDTYPDRTRHRTLIIYDTKENKRYDIARLFAPFKYHGEVRCDLHPRWSRDGKHVCFDSVHEGKRQLYIIKNVIEKLEELE
jgi:Tol biopolymer transport system component